MTYPRIAIPVILIVSFIVCSSVVSAQIRWGGQAGVTFSNLDIESDAVVATNNIIGYVVGLRGEYQVTRALSVYLSPQYVLKGSDVEVERYDEAWGPISYTVREKYHYVEVPLGLRLRLPASGIKPYVFGGVGVASLMSAPFSTQVHNSGTVEEEYEQDGTNFRTDIDVIFHAGIGAEMPLSQSTSLTFDIRYSRSLQTMDAPEYDSDTTIPIYTSDIMLVVGVLFR